MLTALHGFTETDESWCEVLSVLKIPMRCPLLPGHGWKPCPEGSTFPQVADEIAAQMPDGGDVLGYSMGGRIAIQLALAHPEKVSRLLLISATAGIADDAERERRHKYDSHYAEVLIEDGIGPFVSWWESNPALKPARPFTREQTHHLRCRRLNQDPIGLAHALLRLGAGVMPNLWPQIRQLRMPVFIITGAEDRRYCEIANAMAAEIPNAKRLEIAGSGHAVHREQPEQMLTAIKNFLH